MDRSTDAFVIWIDGEPAARDGVLVGRIEHVQTAVRGSFSSAQELLAFLAAHRSVPKASSDAGDA
jgi:hypothetical protein